MNYQFIIENLVGIQLRRIVWLLLMLFCTSVSAQVVYPDSITIQKKWIDGNGENRLTVKVNALCNPSKMPIDGHPTKFEANLQMKNSHMDIVYDDSSYQMEMILFEEKEIWFYELNKVKAVFIPFLYCSNEDNDVKVSYAVFYGDKKYLFHFNFRCKENGICKLNEEEKKKLTLLQPELKRALLAKLLKKYKTAKQINKVNLKL
jgi:hypothetical protein